MGRILFIMIIMLVSIGGFAQPKARRNATKESTSTTQSTNSGLTQRARLMYPTAIEMPQDVVWRRDIYREVDLMNDANAGLYYPVEPIERQLNLFTYVFKLALNGYIPVYEYRLDGNEVLTDSARVQMKTILENYHIYYEESAGKLRVDNSDIPSAEVTLYYLKESAYYDDANASFHRKVIAFCPVMVREDDWGGEAAKYPLFWVKYSDVEPFLSRQTVMTSNYNNAAVMTMDDYFTLNRYEGKIYKTNNMLGLTLAQYCPTDSAMAKEQKKIEAELAAFEKNLFGDHAKRDSLDSVAVANANTKTKSKKKSSSTVDTTSSETNVKATKTKTKKSSSTSSGTRLSVRRERH